MRSGETRIRCVYRKRERRLGDAERGSRPGEAGERRLFIRVEREEREREGGRDETRRDDVQRKDSKASGKR